MKIGAITIGQSPRVDVTADIKDIFGNDVEILEAGALDGLSREEIEKFAPEDGDYVLVSRLKDGSFVTFAERFILPRLQEAIDKMEDAGCRFIMFFCTGNFPDTLASKKIPLIYPCTILERIVPLMTKQSQIICVTPSELQLAQSEEKWKNHVSRVTSVAANPYDSWEQLEKAAEKVKNMDGDLIVLDCIGYSQKMKDMFTQKTGKMVILPRTLLARVCSEATDVKGGQ